MKQGAQYSIGSEQRWRRFAGAAWPWVLFAALLAWGWRTTALTTTVPAYGDVLEGLWAVDWYDMALRTGADARAFSGAFHPEGWQVATYAWGPLNLAFLLPLAWLGGLAFAYNVSTLLTFVLAFAGALRLARTLLDTPSATVAALLYTFWGFRWYGIIGQLNVSLASAVLPWMLWTLDQGMRQEQRARRWFLLTGVLWAVAVNSSLYFLWIGGVALLAWALGRARQAPVGQRALWLELALIPVVAGLLSLPQVIWFMRASAAASATFFSLFEVSLLGASANSLPAPYLQHPYLQAIAQTLFRGTSDSEANLANFGLLACLVAGFGVVIAARSKLWRPVLILAAVSLVLALGLVLRWDDRTVQWSAMQPLNSLIWRLGFALKPELFGAPQVAYPFAEAVPLPGMLAAIIVPFFERARVFARYALPAGLAIFLLAGLGLSRVRHGWLRAGIAILLLLEMLPPPTQAYAFPPASHPAYEWLEQQSPQSVGVLEVDGQPGQRLGILGGGDALWSTRYHRQAIVGGASSIWPAHTVYLVKWLAEHPQPFTDTDFTSILHFFGVRYVLLHMVGDGIEEQLAGARSRSDLNFVRCFDSAPPPYDRPICVLEAPTAPAPEIDLLPRAGWSGQESWGRWLDGPAGEGLFVATARAPLRLTLGAFPFCVPEKPQTITVEVNQVVVGSHDWGDCEPWSGQFDIPAELLRVGENELILRPGYAVRPADVTNGENPDARSLSIGVTQLRLEQP